MSRGSYRVSGRGHSHLEAEPSLSNQHELNPSQQDATGNQSSRQLDSQPRLSPTSAPGLQIMEYEEEPSAPSYSSHQRDLENQLSTEQQSSSPSGVSTLQRAAATPFSSHERDTDDQLPTEQQSSSPSGVSTLQRAAATPFSSHERDTDDQLPTEHAQQPSSPSGVSTLQRAVVVDGRVNWRDDNEADTEITNASTPNGMSGAHEETDNVPKDYPEKQTEVISNIITALYHEARKFGPNDPYKTPGCEACTDVVYQKIHCLNAFKMDDENKFLLSDILRRGRAQGWKMLAKIVFPLLPDAAREIWVVGEILTAMLGLMLSIAAVVLRPQEPFGKAHVGVITLFCIFALIDGILTLKDCKLCRKCYHIYKGKYHSQSEYVPYFKCCTKTCVTRSKNVLDVTRVVATDLTLYLLVVCDIFKVITGRRYVEGAQDADRLAIVLLVLTSVSFIVHVYIARVVILVIAMKRILAIRSPNYKLNENYNLLRQNHFDFSLRKSAFWYQLYILIHTILQMITQLLIFVAIGAKMYNDNQNLFSDDITDRSVHFSAYLWYLIVVGFITPIFGLITAVLATYYWTQEFAIGLCLDIVGIWNMAGPEDFVYMKEQLRDRLGTRISRVINQFLKVEEMREEFKQFRKEKWHKKLLYFFASPPIVITCTIYLILQMALLIYAGTQIRSEGHWVYICIVAIVIFSVLANALSMSAAIFWTTAVLGSIAILFSTLALLPITGISIILYLLYKNYKKE